MHRPVLAVERAARKDLRELPEPYRSSAVAKGYLLLARRLDAGVSARDSATLLTAMRHALRDLHEMAPPVAEDSFVDEVAQRREQWMKKLAAGDGLR